MRFEPDIGLNPPCSITIIPKSQLGSGADTTIGEHIPG
jgi:hypothetical protein